jgi:diacylglycerol kinase (ATP)
MLRALLVVNAGARRGRTLGGLVRGELLAHGITPVEVAGNWPDDLAPFDCIVAAGGDGTLSRLIDRAQAANVPIGLIPLGTFNELARTLQIPLDVEGACRVIAAGQTRAIDVARVNGVAYVNEASIGVSSRAARLQLPQDKQRFGTLAVATTAVQALWHSRPFAVEIAYDGRTERFRTIQLTVANSHRFGGFVHVAGAGIDDGWLDLYSVEIDGVVKAFSVVRAMLSGHGSVPGLLAFRSREFYVRTRRRQHITADGEPAGHTPAVFEVSPKALRVYAPE